MNSYSSENNLNHHRRSIRLKGYDYSQAGLYFITICCQKGEIFGKIINDKMILNEEGNIVANEWLKSENIRDEIKLHIYIIMPNHFHAIVEIINVGANGRSPVHDDSPVRDHKFSMQEKSIGSLMSGFKSSVTVKINRMRKTGRGERSFASTRSVWHRNYWDHIIRNENEYFRIAEYIKANPLKWNSDKLNGGTGNIVMDSNPPYNEEIWMI